MKIKTSYLILCTLFFLSMACDKEDDTTTPTTPVVCDVRATYSGLNTASTGGTYPTKYDLRDNNFAVGYEPNNVAVTFGGYRNTCDSVILSVYYTTNSSYYLLQGKLLNNGTTIAGSYKNLTTPSDFGTFTMSK